MRNTISNLLTPKGRWLPTLLLLFTLGIGQMWATCDPGTAIFEFAVKDGLTNGNIAAGNPVDLGSYVTVTTGSVSAYAKDAGDLTIVDTKAINIADKGNSHLNFALADGCTFQAGDIIKYVIYNKNALLQPATNSETADKLTLTKTANITTEGTVVIPTGHALVGKSTFYLYTGDNGCKIKRIEIIRPYTITLDATTNGGLEVDPVKGADGDKVILPHAFKKDTDPVKYYKFKGWYENHTGGEPVSNIYTVSEGKTLYAQFENIPTSGPMFTLQMESSLKPASSVDLKAASSSETVYLNLLQYATISGGAAVASTKGTSAGIQILATPAIKMNGQGGCIKVDLDAPLQSGDEITAAGVSANIWFTNSDTRPSSAPSTILGKTSPTKIVCDGSNLTGQTFYIYYSGSGASFTGLTITRPAPAATYTVTFDNNGHGGTAPDAQSGITSGGKATEPTEPEDASYNFGGWYNMEDWADPSAEKWNFGTSTVTKDTTLYAKWTDKSVPSTDATLSALSVAGCTFNETFDPATFDYTVDLPFYASMPTASAVTATKNDANASDPVVSISGNVISVEVTPQSGEAGKKTYTITVNIAAAPAASSSINIEQLILDYGKSYNIGTALNNAHIAYTDKDALDSLKNQDGRNEPFLGLKFKKATSSFTIIVPASTALKVKFGSINSAAGLKVSVNGSTPAAPSVTSGVYTLAASTGMQEVIFTLDVKDKTVVLKQVMIGEDIQSVQLPWLVTYDAGEHGTCATAKETWTGTALTLPAATPEDGWSFDGWKDDENNDATSPYTPTKDVVLTAQYTALASPFDLTALTYQIGTAAAQNVGYTDGVFTYNIELPYKPSYAAITVAPTLKVGTSSIKEGAVLTVSSLPGAATFTVVEAGGANEKQYTINFTKAPKDGTSIIKAVASATAQDITGANLTGAFKGAAHIETAGSYKLNEDKYFMVQLVAGQNFQAGDIVKINVSAVNDCNGFTLYSSDEFTAANLIIDTHTNSDAVDKISAGINKVELPSSFLGSNKLYVARAHGADKYLNAGINQVEVTRVLNPQLVAITIDGEDGVINEAAKTVAVTIPYASDLAALTVVPTIAWNEAAASNSIVLNDGGDWALGANTYKLTDKDDDATTYTITLTRAAHYEAQIGTTSYATLVEAVAAAQADDVVQLLDNVDLMATGLTIAENITLDLNGFNIKAGEQLTNNINVPAGVKLTLVDNSANAEGKIYTEEAYAGANTGYGVIRVAGEFLMQSGNIYAVIESDPANLGQFAVVLGAGGKATIEGGQIKAGWYAISNNGNNTGSTIIVSGGELISTADFAIYNPAKESTVTVSGGVVYGAAGGIAMNRGELTVTGGTITSKDQGTTGTWGDGTGGLSNAAISASGKYESVEVEITGGTIIAEGTAVMITNGTTNPVEVAISGGQFSHVVPAEYCAEGFAPVTTPNAQSKYEVEDKRIYIFNGTTSSATMATSPSGAIAWEIVGSTMGEASKSGTYDEVNYVKALQLKNSSTTKHFRIDVDINNNAKIEVIGKSNSSDETRHAWLTNSTEKGEYASAIAGLASSTSPAAFATDWLEEGSYYLHADESVNIFLIRVTEKAVDPKCEVPTITAQPETNITFGAGDMTATIEAEVSDGGTLKYQWYNAEGDVAVTGQTTATLTTAVEGTYYVVVTNVLAGHQNTSVTSDEAELGYRVTNDATLMALSYGTPATAIALEDGVYTYDVELAKGTTDVPALAATATMAGYANVTIDNATEFVSYAASSTVTVKSEDQTVTKVYTVNFTVKHDLPQVDVTASTVWDMNNVSADPIELTGSDKNARLLLANIDGVNNTTFNAQALMFEGQHIGRTGAGIKHLAGRYVQFNVTVPGAVFVTFESNGNNARTISINGKKCARTTSGTAADDYITYALAVEPGSVEIIGYEGESANQYVRISKIEFTAADESRANLQLGGIGTVCLPFDVATTDRFGGTFYKADYQGPGFAYFIEETGTLEAGKPYVYVADTTFIVLLQDANANTVTDPTPYRGMYGTFTDMAAGSLTDKYVIAQKKLRRCGAGATLAAYRAYIDLTEMPTTPLEVNDPANAPVRRRLGIGGNNGSTTDLQNYFEFNAEGTQKVIMNGQLYILRDGKMYNAQGQLMK